MDLKFHPFSEKNKFGYYSVGQYNTYSKVDAIEVGHKLNLPVEWHFNDEVFDNVDWTVEPDVSLWELYTLRARQLREKYDYLVLFYSGGADSNNIFNSFVKNNIHLDEVVQWTNYEVTGDKENNWNAEVFKVAVPTTAKLIDDNKLKTRHRIVDMSKLLTTLDKTIPDIEEWVYGKNSYFSPNMRATALMRKHTPEYQELISQGKKVCFVWGCEKPMLVNSIDPNNKSTFVPTMVFQDRVDHCISVKDQVENFDWVHDELFYWTPDLPLIVVKQCHAVAKFFKTATPLSNFLSTEKQGWGSTVINGITYFLTANGLNQLIYPFWNPDTFSIGKNPSVVFSARDYWILQDDNPIQKMQMEAIRQTQHRVKDKWAGPRWGITHYHSPGYNLAPLPENKIVLGPHNNTVINNMRNKNVTAIPPATGG